MIATATELLKKYDVPGPRYTSYPTVLYWDRNPTPDEWVAGLGAGLDEESALGEGAAQVFSKGGGRPARAPFKICLRNRALFL